MLTGSSRAPSVTSVTGATQPPPIIGARLSLRATLIRTYGPDSRLMSADRRQNTHVDPDTRRSVEDPRDAEWRRLNREVPDLATEISDRIGGSASVPRASKMRLIRAAPSLGLFSDYGGAHKGAPFEVFSFLVTTPYGLLKWWGTRQRLREGELGTERRMAYKRLNDKVRLNCLPDYLEAVDQIEGLLVNFAIDKNAAHRLSEEPQTEIAFGQIGVWAPRAFRKLTTIGHLAGILVEGIRGDGQDLLWITDEDDIAPNLDKHAEATRLLAHYVSAYCTGALGHFRFGTTASDPGDLHIEDLAAVPDLAAGCLNDVLTEVFAHPQSQSVERLFVPPSVGTPTKLRLVAEWLAGVATPLAKLNIVVDENNGRCSVRHFSVVTDLTKL